MKVGSEGEKYDKNESEICPWNFKGPLWCALTHKQLSNGFAVLKEMVHS